MYVKRIARQQWWARIETRQGRDKEGQLYSADIPENDEVLDWDKPLSEQPPKVQEALRPLIARFYGDANVDYVLADGEGSPKSGREFYNALSAEPRGASEMLRDAGIPGLRYLDGNSRGKGEGSANYVIWDEALLTPQKAQIQTYYQSALPRISQTGNGASDFVTFDGSPDLAVISPGVVRQQAKGGSLVAGPIRLRLGRTSPRGQHRGFGLRHIEEEHADDIHASGMDAASYVWQFFTGVQRIYQEQEGVFFLQGRSRDGKTAMIRLEREGDAYVVHTLYNKGQRNLGKLVWSGRPDSLSSNGSVSGSLMQQAAATADSSEKSLAAPLSPSPATKQVNPIRVRAGLASQTSAAGFTQRTASQQARGAFSPERLTISLLKGADLSTVLHEGGHFFFENDIALASELHRPPAMASAD